MAIIAVEPKVTEAAGLKEEKNKTEWPILQYCQYVFTGGGGGGCAEKQKCEGVSRGMTVRVMLQEAERILLLEVQV